MSKYSANKNIDPSQAAQQARVNPKIVTDDQALESVPETRIPPAIPSQPKRSFDITFKFIKFK